MLNKALQNFLLTLDNRTSHLVDQLDGNVLSLEEVVKRVEYSVISVFEERCSRTNRRKAIWHYNRTTNTATPAYLSVGGLQS